MAAKATPSKSGMIRRRRYPLRGLLSTWEIDSEDSVIGLRNGLQGSAALKAEQSYNDLEPSATESNSASRRREASDKKISVLAL